MESSNFARSAKAYTMIAKMNSAKKNARIAGFLYLLVVIFGGFAHFFVRVSLVVPGDAEATVHRIMASESRFRTAFVSDIIAQTCFLLLLLALYKLLKPVNNKQAFLMLTLAIVGVPITCINMLNQYAVLVLLSGADYLSVFKPDQLHALAMLFIDFHAIGYTIAHVFFGLWLLPLGYLVFRSGFLPRILGILLMIATFGYLTGCLTSFLFPRYTALIQPVYIEPTIAEILLCLWLLIKGIKTEIPAKVL